MKSSDVGRNIEDQIGAFLQKEGLTLIERNFTGPQGEIDLIMRDQEYLVFIEVRFRSHDEQGDPLETISLHKQQRIIKTAWFYLQKKQLIDQIDCRFDVVAVNQGTAYNWIKNAFDVRL